MIKTKNSWSLIAVCLLPLSFASFASFATAGPHDNGRGAQQSREQ